MGTETKGKRKEKGKGSDYTTRVGCKVGFRMEPPGHCSKVGVVGSPKVVQQGDQRLGWFKETASVVGLGV